MQKIVQRTKENPRLLQRPVSGGRISLYLEYYLGREQWEDEDSGKTRIKHDRRKETLNLYLVETPRSPLERQNNKETLELARAIRGEREQELKRQKTGKRLPRKGDNNILHFFDEYANGYAKRDVRQIRRAVVQFGGYLRERHGLYSEFLPPERLDKEMVVGFVAYLQARYRGEGPHSVFARFKKMVKHAVEKEILAKDPCSGVKCTVDRGTLKKDVLSEGELQALARTTYPGQNPEIRRAFIFCLYTGIRYCDVAALTYENVDFANGLLKFDQLKTAGHSAASGVVIPLNPGLLSIVGTPGAGGRGERVFHLPSHTMCLKALRHWTARAGIDKHVTWHCARHSFAVNILNNGANIKTVASLLGHSGLRHTEKYTRAVDSLKEAAINSLPEIIL